MKSNVYSADDNSHTYYYVYNVTNPRAFLKGEEAPNVVEVGPFGYGTISRKYDVQFLKIDEISYKSYAFKKPLSALACQSGQEVIGHPSPAQCLDPQMKLTTLNLIFAGVMDNITPDQFLSLVGGQVLPAIVSEVVNGVDSDLKNQAFPQMLAAFDQNYRLKSGVNALQATVLAAVAGGDRAAYVATLNVAGAASDKNSPMGSIAAFFAASGLAAPTHVFATYALLNVMYEPTSPYSPFHPGGFLLWKYAAYGSPPHVGSLQSFCASDGTTDCPARVGAIIGWLFSGSGWAGFPETNGRMYSEFIYGVNTFACNDQTLCNWNIGPSMAYNGAAAPPVSFGVYFSLFSPAPNDISFLQTANYETYKQVKAYCRNPTLNCATFAPHEAAFRKLFDGFYGIDNPSGDIAAAYNNQSTKAYYTAQICGVQSYVTKLYMNPLYDAVVASQLPTILKPLFDADPSLAGITQVADIAFHQLATGALSKLLSGKDTISPEGKPPVEFFHYMDHNMTWLDAKFVYLTMAHPEALPDLIKVVHNSTVDDVYSPQRFRTNLDANFTEVVQAPVDAILARRNAAGNETIGSSAIKMLATFLQIFYLEADHIVCNDPANCDYAKGGYFHTTTVENILFNGYSDSGLNLLATLVGNGRFQSKCLQQKYYYTDGTSGPTETNGKTFLRDSSCSTTRDLDCTDHGIEVIDSLDGAVYNWTRNSTDPKILSRYYNISGTFSVGNATIGLPPIVAHSLGANFANIEFQRLKGCGSENCSTTINNGAIDRALTGTIVRSGGLEYSTGWPNPIKMKGSQGGQFPPLYLDGMTAEDCPPFQEMYVSAMQGTMRLDFLQQGTIDYTNDEQSSINVCRYALSKSSYEKTIDGLNNTKNLMPPPGFIPGPPGVNGTTPNKAAGTFPSFALDVLFNEGKEFKKFTGLKPDMDRHGSYVDVEQSTGAVFRAAVRNALHYKISRNSIFPHLKEDYYLFPTIAENGGGAIPADVAQSTGQFINIFRKLPSTVTALGIGTGITCILVGFIFFSRNKATVKPH